MAAGIAVGLDQTGGIDLGRRIERPDHLGRAEHAGNPSGRGQAGAERGREVVARADRNHGALRQARERSAFGRQAAGRRLRFGDRRQLVLGDAEGIEQLWSIAAPFERIEHGG